MATADVVATRDPSVGLMQIRGNLSVSFPRQTHFTARAGRTITLGLPFASCPKFVPIFRLTDQYFQARYSSTVEALGEGAFSMQVCCVSG